MGMYSLIEDARTKAMDAANCWQDTPEAQSLLVKIDAYERLSDRWYAENADISGALKQAADDAEQQLEDIRNRAVSAAADTYGGEHSDEWLDAWTAADEEAPALKDILQQARRNNVGDDYLERMAA